MAETRTINVNIKNNADKTAKDFDNLNDSLDETAKANEQVNESFDTGATFAKRYGDAIEPLTTRMGEAEDRLYELALAGDTASQEYQELLTKVGEYRKVQIQTDLAVDGAATTMTQKLGGALTGATSGFAAVQGVMGLVGSESEALEKTLLKVQSALAIQQGVQGIRESLPMLKQMGTAAKTTFSAMTTGAKAFAVTGIGLILTAVAAVVYAMSEMEESEADLEEQRKQREEQDAARHQAYLARQQAKINAIQKESQAAIDELDRERRLALAQGKSVAEFEKAILEQTLKGIEETGQAFVVENEEIRKSVKELNDDRLIYVQNLAYESGAEKKASQQYIAWIDKELAAHQKRNKEIVKLVGEETEKKKEALTEIAVYDAEILQDRKAKYKQYAADRLSIARQIEDIENLLLQDGIEKELEINRDKFRRLREDVKGNREERKILTDLYNQQEAQAEAKIIADNQKRREDAFETERSERVELLNFVDELNTKEVESEKAKNIAILDNAVETNEKLIESDKAVAEAKKNIQDAQIANVEAGISLLKDVAGENNKLQAFAIAAENAVGIAKIIISTQAANAAAKLKYAAIPGGLALAAAEITANKVSAGIGIAASVAAAAKGIASLKASASLDSGGSLGGGGAGTEAAAPQFNVVGDSGINQIAQLQQQPVQAFVVSGEVTTSQALDRNRVQNATL